MVLPPPLPFYLFIYYCFFNELGLATVRGYSKQENFIRRYERERMDTNARPFWQSVITNRWIGTPLNILFSSF